jgi:tetraacyldisaccharide 4'-kinase
VSRGRPSLSTTMPKRWGDGGTSSAPLDILARAYRGGLAARQWLYGSGILKSRSVSCGVIAVGNLTLGGTGKTPAVEHTVRTLLDLGARPAILSRGYGRRSRGLRVVSDVSGIRLDPLEAGDEPFLLARRLPGVPVIVGANRYETARLAVARFGVTAVVMDDGFQHRSLTKDAEIVMVRAANPWGNGRLLPAGPLREPLGALARAALVVATGARSVADAAEVSAAVARHAPGTPVLAAGYEADGCWDASGGPIEPPGILAGRRLLGFAGIGTPVGFRRTLEELGVVLLDYLVFPDHHWYESDDLTAIGRRADDLAADGLVTTEKDWVRLRGFPAGRRPLLVLGVRLALLDGHAQWRAILAAALP